MSGPPKPVHVEPHHWSEESETTGEHEIPRDAIPSGSQPGSMPIATTAYVKRKVEVVAHAQQVMQVDVEASLVDAVIAKGRALAAIVISAVAVTATVLFGLDTRAQSKVDGGIAPVAADVAELKREVKEMKRDQQQQALEGTRTSASIDMLLRKEGIRPLPPIPPPAPILDGGR